MLRDVWKTLFHVRTPLPLLYIFKTTKLATGFPFVKMKCWLNGGCGRMRLLLASDEVNVMRER